MALVAITIFKGLFLDFFFIIIHIWSISVLQTWFMQSKITGVLSFPSDTKRLQIFSCSNQSLQLASLISQVTGLKHSAEEAAALKVHVAELEAQLSVLQASAV